MQIFWLTVGFFGVAMAIMAIGVAVTGKELQGSCGGVKKCLCELTGRELPDACKELREAAAALKD
jgi:hypothetical protein